MTFIKPTSGAPVVAALSLGAFGPAAAQNQGGLVNVVVDDVEILNDANIAVPVTVQAPIGIAANVCNVGANVLAADIRQDGEAECTAEQGSEAFSRLATRQLQ